ncbi:MAG TPA: alpha/beta fold hydrolase [Allosphingosinicella sp.]|nr:alpha/beta fold hydrolase [Allosphingosinicella sp.]
MKRRRILIVLALLMIAGLGAAWGFGSLAGRPYVEAIAPPAPPGRVVRLVAADGVHIEGSFWPGARIDGPAVLLLHGINSSRASFTRHALWLNGLGYAVLAIDFRGHGGSEAVPRTFGLYEARDAAAALDFLRAGNPVRRVGVIGTSLGGAAALLGDRGPLPVQVMVLQAVYPDLRRAISNRIARVAGQPLAWLGEPLLSYQSWPRYGVPPGRIAPIEGLRRFRGPVLIVGGTADSNTTIGDTRAFHEAAPGPKALWLLPGVGHAATGSIFTDDYRRRVGALFAATLGRP